MDASSFSKVIQAASVLERFITPNFKIYLKMTDPIVHVQNYRRVMSCYQQDDTLLCKVSLVGMDEGFIA